MKENNQTILTLRDVLDSNAAQILNAEIQLRQILPEWINKAWSVKLKNVIQRYIEFIERHIRNIEDFYEEEALSSLSDTSRTVQACIEETEEKLSACIDSKVKDACLLSGIQIINHIKISMYGTAAAFANALSMEKSAAGFHEAEANEKQIDDRLSQLAEHDINIEAKASLVLPG